MGFIRKFQLKTRESGLLWLGIVIVYFSLRIQPLEIPLDRDEGIFGLIGQTILNGGLPYLDALDHKPPVVYYIYALALSFLPPTAFGIHLFLHFYNLLTLIVLFFIAKRIIGPEAGFWVAFIYAVSSISPYIQGFTASTELFMLLPLMLSLWLSLLATEDNIVRIPWIVLSGGFGALACWCKQPAVTSVAFVLILIVYRILTFQPPAQRTINCVKAISMWLIGGIVISLLIIAYFASQGIVYEFFYWSFQHNLLYTTGATLWDKLALALSRLWHIALNIPIVFALAFIGIFLKPKAPALPPVLFFIFVVLSFVGTTFGSAYRHYFAQLAPALALLSGMAVFTIVDRVKDSRAKNIITCLVLSILLIAEILPNYNYYFSQSPKAFSRKFFGNNPFPESVSIAEYLKKNTDPEDKIFIYGSEAQILLMAERPSATAFYNIYPLMQSKYPRYLEFQERVIKEVSQARPKYIISVFLPSSFLYDGKAQQRTAVFLEQYSSKYYRIVDQLFYNPIQQAWVSRTHENSKREDKAKNGMITILRRKDIVGPQ
tara:strand:- start:519 stop:2153 length:1635 start_codon:yes stop_codon:yes gene_type:complete